MRAQVKKPHPIEIRDIRKEAGLTQTEAAALVYSSLNAWQKWEAGDRAMHPAFWELFKIKVEIRRRSKNV